MPESNKREYFTGLNNLEIISIMNKNYAEYFGFTPKEVESMLCDYGIEGKSDEVKHGMMDISSEILRCTIPGV